MNPNIKVGKLDTYRKSPTNTENRKDAKDNDTKKLSKKTRIELQYYHGQGKYNILLYLMSYPSSLLLKYFIEELNLPINLYKKNALYFLFDNIEKIKVIEQNNKMVINTLNYLIEKGINKFFRIVEFYHIKSHYY